MLKEVLEPMLIEQERGINKLKKSPLGECFLSAQGMKGQMDGHSHVARTHTHGLCSPRPYFPEEFMP